MKTNRKIRAKARLGIINSATKVIDYAIDSGEIIMNYDDFGLISSSEYRIKELKLGEGFNFQIEDKKQPYTCPAIDVEDQCRGMAEEVVAHQIKIL